MTIRASGTHGPPRARVTYHPSEVNTLAARFGIGGPWFWRIPAPKGHPLPPPMQRLYGSEPTAARAADTARARIREIYGEPPTCSS